MHTKANNTKKIIISLAALLAVALVFFCVYHFTKKAPVAGAKTISVEVVHGDGSRKTFEYHTDREYLGEVLKDEELVDGRGKKALSVAVEELNQGKIKILGEEEQDEETEEEA